MTEAAWAETDDLVARTAFTHLMAASLIPWLASLTIYYGFGPEAGNGLTAYWHIPYTHSALAIVVIGMAGWSAGKEGRDLVMVRLAAWSGPLLIGVAERALVQHDYHRASLLEPLWWFRNGPMLGLGMLCFLYVIAGASLRALATRTSANAWRLAAATVPFLVGFLHLYRMFP